MTEKTHMTGWDRGVLLGNFFGGGAGALILPFSAHPQWAALFTFLCVAGLWGLLRGARA